jgi:diguanylate cyclase (GGDEF)-like protein/PAS domain S-box-containing protein
LARLSLGLNLGLVLLLLTFGLAPAVGVASLAASTRHQEAGSDVDARLAAEARTAEFQLSNDLERFQQILLTSAQNPAHVQILREPDQRAFWKGQLDAALLQLTTNFPGMIDEVCRIDPAGVELARVVQGRVAPDNELSPDEAEDNPAFAPTMALPSGAVHFEPPYISPDTHRWVLAAATPIFADDGTSLGILHFEVPLAYFDRTLRSTLPADGYLAVADPVGQVYFASDAPEPTAEPMAELRNVLHGVQLDDPDGDLLADQSEPGLWAPNSSATTYRLHAQRIEPADGLPLVVLVGVPAAPDFAEHLREFLVPLGLGAGALLLVALAVAAVMGRPSGPTRDGDDGTAPSLTPRRNTWLMLPVVVGLALVAAGGVSALHHSADGQRQLDGELGRLGSLSREIEDDLDHAQETPNLPDLHDALQDYDAQASTQLATISDLAGGSGQAAQAVGTALAEYRADVDELVQLGASDRQAEAHLWYQQRVQSRFHALLDTLSDQSTLAHQAAERTALAADVGATLVLVLAALLMALLLRRSERARQTAAVLASEQQALQRSEERFRKLVQQGAELVTILSPDGTVRYCSPSATTLLGQPAADLIGSSLCARIHPDDAPAWRRLLEETAASPQQSVRAEFRLQHASGSWRHVEALCRDLVGDPDIAGILLNGRDVTKRKALEDQLAHRAFHDELTELPNRSLLFERLEQALARAARTRRGTALLFVDLDDFKVVNDSLGHRAGDQLLVGVAQRLRASLRPGDTAARLGGDEFVMLVEDLAGAVDAEAVAQRVLEQLRAPFALEGRQVFVAASVGIALAGAEDALPDDLLRRADVALYAAKTRGKGQVVIYDGTMDAQPLARLELEADLRRALEREEFRLYYQPIVNLETGAISGVEALLRWHHPERGVVAPLEFIPLAEETGMIVPIGRWALHEACRQAQAWLTEHPYGADMVTSVNLSARQFQHPRLVEDVAEALRAAGLPANRLKLEITESVAMEAGIGTIQTLQALKGLGVQLAIDDFGTGYSSLAYLKRFPVDTLKVDKSFVDGLGHDEQDTAIVQSVVALARTLSLSVTAEGIETREQLAALCAVACEEGQGFYFARPQPAEQVGRLLATGLALPTARPAA